MAKKTPEELADLVERAKGTQRLVEQNLAAGLLVSPEAAALLAEIGDLTGKIKKALDAKPDLREAITDELVRRIKPGDVPKR